MSYLELPRLHFAGRFQTTVSTINNTPTNYNIETYTPGQGDKDGWNPRGTAIWRLVDCTVRRVCYQDGSVCDSSANDSLIGAAITGADDRVDAKLVDLDPQQQLVSEIWGFVVRLRSALTGDWFAGDYTVAAFTDIWKRFANGPNMTDSVFSAYYQSVIAPVTWSDGLRSRFLRELRQSSPDRLSIKFVVDGFVDNPKAPDFTYGRIVGTIGPASEEEPEHAIVGRMLRPEKSSPLTYAYCKVDAERRKLILDMGNSIPTTAAGGPPEQEYLDSLSIAISQQGQSPVYQILGPINCDEANYLAAAGLQEFDLTPEQLALLDSAPLAVIQHDPQGTQTVLLQENSIGAYVRADNFVFRMNPGDTADVYVIATQFGKPAAGQQIDLGYSDVLKADNGKDRKGQHHKGQADPVVGIPTDALRFPTSITTDAQGRASFQLSAGDPNNPRKYIDGQMYAVSYSWSAGPSDYNPSPNNYLSVHVWDQYTYTGEPTWWDHVYPIFKQYANLYPIMSDIVDLGDYQSVVKHLDILKLAFGLPVTDPNHMPVTRDLSSTKLDMILRWFENPLEGVPKQ